MNIVYTVVDWSKTTEHMSPFISPVDFSEVVYREGVIQSRFELYEVTLPSWMSPTAFFTEWTWPYFEFLECGCSPYWDEDVWTGLRLVLTHDIDMFLAALYLLRTRVRDPGRKDAKKWLEEWLSTRPTIVPTVWLPPLHCYDVLGLSNDEQLRLRQVPHPSQYLLLEPLSGNVNCDGLITAMQAAMCLADFGDDQHEMDPSDLDLLAGMA